MYSPRNQDQNSVSFFFCFTLFSKKIKIFSKKKKNFFLHLLMKDQRELQPALSATMLSQVTEIYMGIKRFNSTDDSYDCYHN